MADTNEKITVWQLVMLFLCVWVLASLFIEVTLPLSKETRDILWLADTGVCVLFLADFFCRFWKSPNKIKFMKWGWIDFVSSIPTVPAFRVGRVFQLMRILRLFRAFRSVKQLSTFILKNRAKSALASAGLIAFLAMVFSAIAILYLERDTGKIKDAEGALWWAMVTTVGYGDYYPVTIPGRLIAAGLMLVGIGFLGTFTAAVAGYFTERKFEEEQATENAILRELRAIDARLARIEANNTRKAKRKRKI